MDISKPLGTVPFYILLALAQGTSHGYGILQNVRDQSSGHVPLGTGSLYRHLSRLIDAGLVAEQPCDSESDPRRGRHYALTTRGREVLAAERDRLAGLVHALDTLGDAPRKEQA